MKTTRRILLYGNSAILGTIGASLRRRSEFEVTALTAPLPDAQLLDDAKPDILLFDLEAPHAGAVFSLLKADPTILLIGISPGINLVDVWSIRELRDISMLDLFELIKNRLDNLSTISGGDKGRQFRSLVKGRPIDPVMGSAALVKP